MSAETIRNQFALPGTMLVSDADKSTAEQWERQKEKRRVEHERDRDLWIAEGAQLGPMTYTENLSSDDEWQTWRGEWCSEVLVPVNVG